MDERMQIWAGVISDDTLGPALPQVGVYLHSALLKVTKILSDLSVNGTVLMKKNLNSKGSFTLDAAANAMRRNALHSV